MQDLSFGLWILFFLVLPGHLVHVHNGFLIIVVRVIVIVRVVRVVRVGLFVIVVIVVAAAVAAVRVDLLLLAGCGASFRLLRSTVPAVLQDLLLRMMINTFFKS